MGTALPSGLQMLGEEIGSPGLACASPYTFTEAGGWERLMCLESIQKIS